MLDYTVRAESWHAVFTMAIIAPHEDRSVLRVSLHAGFSVYPRASFGLSGPRARHALGGHHRIANDCIEFR